MKPLLTLLLLTASTVHAAEPAASILVEPDQLQSKLNDKNLRVLDVRSAADYSKGHIPGAVRVDVGSWKNLATADNGLRDAKGWTEILSPLGLTKTTHVVVYGGSLSNTSRIWWLLKYVGVKNAAILNGGWEWWTKKDRPTATSAPKIAAVKFKPKFQADRIEEMDSLKKSLNSDKLTIVDTRSDREFSAGRIPGSAHLEWKELVAKDGRFKSKKELQQLFRQRGILPAHTAVCY